LRSNINDFQVYHNFSKNFVELFIFLHFSSSCLPFAKYNLLGKKASEGLDLNAYLTSNQWYRWFKMQVNNFDNMLAFLTAPEIYHSLFHLLAMCNHQQS
jgi:hypothetical protein